MSQGRLKNFPVSFFSMIMGLAGLTIATEKVEPMLGLGNGFSLVLSILSLAVFLLLLTFYVIKIIRHKDAVIGEFNHPIKLHFFPTISISLLLLSVVFINENQLLSQILWVLGALLHLFLTLKIITMWIEHSHFEIAHMNPSWFIPAVGNIIVPVAGTLYAPIEISWFFFSIGLMFWIILLVIFFNRVIFHQSLPNKLLPTLFILIAPPAVGVVSYFRLTKGIDNFSNVLYYFGLFLLLLLCFQIRKFTKIQFFLSWWAYSFPVAAITIATTVMYHQTGSALFYKLAFILYFALLILVLLLFIRTLKAIFNGEICVEE